MARINVDDEFWINITDLSVALGCRYKAAGMALEFLRLAQERFKQDRYISDQEFKDRGFNEALFPLFARRVELGLIGAVNDVEQFAWIRSKVENGKLGGVASGESRRRVIEDLEGSQNQLCEPSSSSSSSSSDLNSEELRSSTGEPGSPVPGPKKRKPYRSRYREPFNPRTPEDFIEIVPEKTSETWGELYPEEGWLRAETMKALNYYLVLNPSKSPRTIGGWLRALNSWFERGWVRHVRSKPAVGARR